MLTLNLGGADLEGFKCGTNNCKNCNIAKHLLWSERHLDKASVSNRELPCLEAGWIEVMKHYVPALCTHVVQTVYM